MKYLIACLLLTITLSANAFDTSNFVKKYCTETKDSIVCRNFVFTAAEKNDIQKIKFTISNAPKVELINSDIGSFNENLVNKFPNAVDFNLNGCIVYFNYSVSSISANNAKLTKLSFDQGDFYFNANSAALAKLTGLKTFEFKNPQFIQYPYIDDVFLSKNTNLETVDIRGARIDNITSKAFANLKKLTVLKIIGTHIQVLDPNLIKSNTLLKEINFDSNRIRTIPCDNFFPKTLEKISFRFNQLQFINDKTFAGLNKLKYLSLSNNEICTISENFSTTLTALETIHLNYNFIHEIVKKHFSSCLNLSTILLEGNKMIKVSNDLFDGLNKLVNVVVSDNNM